MSKTTDWLEIMDGLRGRRLAVLDNLERGEPVDFADLKVQEILGWLIYHRFVWRAADRLVVRKTFEAADLWKKEGPAKDAAADVARYNATIPAAVKVNGIGELAPTVEQLTQGTAAPRPVHAHQPQFFADV